MVNFLLLEVRKALSSSTYCPVSAPGQHSVLKVPQENGIFFLNFVLSWFSFCWAVFSRPPGLLSRRSVWASQCSGLSHCRAWALGRLGVPDCNMQAQQLWLPGSRAQAQQMWPIGLVAPRHMGSSPTRDQTCVSCIIGGQILYH